MKKDLNRTGATLCSSMRPRSATTLWLKFKLLAFAFMALLSINAWSATVTYSASTMTSSAWAISTSGTAPTGSSVSCTQTYGTFGQATKGNSFTMTLSNFSADVTKLTFSLRSNTSAGQGNISYSVDGGSEVFLVGTASNSAIAFNTWGDNSSYGTSYRDVNFDVTISPKSSLVIYVRCVTTNSIYFNGLKVTYSTAKSITSLYLWEAGVQSENLLGSYKVGDSYTLPSTTDAECGDKVLVGWSTVEISTPSATKPTSNYYDKGAQVTLADNNTFYAVFADVTGGSETWTEITSEPTAGTYAILTDSYFMKASISSNRFQNGSATPQISNSKLTTAPAEDCIWEISKPDTYYRIKNGSKYAGGTSSKNQGALLDDASADLAKWTISYSDGFTIINYGRSQASSDSNNKYLRNNTTNGWATYASGTGSAPRLFKKSAGTSYSNYTTSCGPSTYTVNFSGQKSGHFQPSFLAHSQIVIWGFFAFFCKKVFHIRCTKGAFTLGSAYLYLPSTCYGDATELHIPFNIFFSLYIQSVKDHIPFLTRIKYLSVSTMGY